MFLPRNNVKYLMYKQLFHNTTQMLTKKKRKNMHKRILRNTNQHIEFAKGMYFFLILILFLYLCNQNNRLYETYIFCYWRSTIDDRLRDW